MRLTALSSTLFSIIFLGIVIGGAAECFSQGLSLSVNAIGRSGVFWLEGNTGGATNLLVEVSTNLTNWVEYLTVHSRSSRFELNEGRILLPANQPRFFRMAATPSQVAERNRNWEERGLTHYRFRYERICFCPPHIFLSAVVTVRDGVVVAVEDIKSLGMPVANPGNAEFKSIEQLFALIEERSADHELVAVGFNDVLDYPERIETEFSERMTDDVESFRASDLVALP